MKQLSLFILNLLFCTLCFAGDGHWTDSYQLTDLQAQLLIRWENENKFDHEKLVSFAKAYEKHNLKPKPYVPEHTFAELQDVSRWAAGAAFSVFAEFAGYSFNNARYQEACPNKLLFNFGYATGTEYFRVDVLEQYISTFNSLQITYSMHPDTFPQKFIELARARGFDSYLSPLAETAQNVY